MPIDPTTRRLAHPASRPLRGLETVSGLLGAGIVIVGLGLLALRLVAPALIANATGPQWSRVVPHLAVGAAAETIRLLRHRWAAGYRWLAASFTVVAVAAVLAFCWWW